MSPDGPAPAIDVAIVNWNTAEAALAAARAYLASEGVEARVTIVDNDSRPEQRELLRAGCPPGARLDLGEENVGYGRAANRVLRGGDAELVCISNADVLPTFLIDGFVAGTWLPRHDAGGEPRAELRPFGRLSTTDRGSLEAEAARLLPTLGTGAFGRYPGTD